MKKAFLFFTLLLSITTTSNAQLSAGPFTVSTAADNAIGTYTWYTFSSGGQIALIFNVPQGQTTSGLRLTNYGFNIPAAANIVGVEAIITFSVPQGAGKDSLVKLVKNNTEVGNSLGNAHTFTSVTTYTYGSSSSLWGTTLTPADVNSANFGVSVRLMNASNTSSMIAAIERSQQQLTKLKVYYESTTGIIESQTSYAHGFSFNKTLSVNGIYEDTKIEIFTITGKKVHESIITGNQTQIDLCNLNTGIYFYKMMVGKKELSSKFVIE